MYNEDDPVTQGYHLAYRIEKFEMDAAVRHQVDSIIII